MAISIFKPVRTSKLDTKGGHVDNPTILTFFTTLHKWTHHFDGHLSGYWRNNLCFEGFGLSERGVNTLICRRGTLGVNVDESNLDDDDTPDPEHIQRLKELWSYSWQDVGIGGCSEWY